MALKRIVQRKDEKPDEPEAQPQPGQLPPEPVANAIEVKAERFAPASIDAVHSFSIKSPSILSVRRTSSRLIVASRNQIMRLVANDGQDVKVTVTISGAKEAVKMVKAPAENKMVEKPDEAK